LAFGVRWANIRSTGPGGDAAGGGFAISAFLLGWFPKVLCSQGVGRFMPLAGKLCVSLGETI